MRSSAIKVFATSAVLIATGLLIASTSASATTVTRQGTLREFAGENFNRGTTARSLWVETRRGKHIALRFAKRKQARKARRNLNRHARVVGNRSKQAILVTRLTIDRRKGSVRAAVSSTGRKRLAVLPLTFRQSNNGPISLDEMKKRVFGDPNDPNAKSVAGYMREASGGKLDIYGEVKTWNTIDRGTGTCPAQYWADQARNIRRTLDDRDLWLYVIGDDISGCTWGGATFGPVEWSIYKWQNFDIGVISHEMGHQFNLQHVTGASCTAGANGTVTTPCRDSNAIDPFDAMSVLPEGPRHWHGIRKHDIGWSDSGVQTVSNPHLIPPQGNTYSIVPSEPGYFGTGILKVGSYVIDYRQPYGLYDNFNINDPISKGVSVRIRPYPYEGGMDSGLIDMTPGTSSTNDASLVPGKRFVDKDSGFYIETVSASGTQATVRIGNNDPLPPVTPVVANVSRTGSKLQAVAAPGVANRLDQSRSGSNIRFSDAAGAVATNGSGGCSRIGDIVECPASGVTAIELHGGDQNDVLRTFDGSTAYTRWLFGATGKDTITGSNGADKLEGGGGIDTLRGGSGNDNLLGGAEGDLLYGDADNDTLDGGAKPDTIDGGAGADLVSYADRAPGTGGAGVIVDLNSGYGGYYGEGDNLTAIENALGSQGDDSLTGNAAGNILFGLNGKDTLTGNGSADLLFGDNDADKIYAADGVVDYVDCGAQSDQVMKADLSGTVKDTLLNCFP